MVQVVSSVSTDLYLNEIKVTCEYILQLFQTFHFIKFQETEAHYRCEIEVTAGSRYVLKSMTQLDKLNKMFIITSLLS